MPSRQFASIRSFCITVTALFILPLLFTSAQSASPIRIYDGWVMPVAAGSGQVTTAYLTIENAGETSVRLVDAATTSAEGVIQAGDNPAGLEIPAGATAILTAETTHLVLVNPLRDLAAGDAIAISLTFELLDGTGARLDVPAGVIVSDEPPAGDFAVYDARARPTALTAESADASGAVGGAYFVIANRSGADDRLVSVTSPAASMIEMHETVLENNVARMQAVDGFDIPAGGQLAFAPGGAHLMLMGLARHLVAGDAIALTLHFASRRQIVVAVPVYEE